MNQEAVVPKKSRVYRPVEPSLLEPAVIQPGDKIAILPRPDQVPEDMAFQVQLFASFPYIDSRLLLLLERIFPWFMHDTLITIRTYRTFIKENSNTSQLKLNHLIITFLWL